MLWLDPNRFFGGGNILVRGYRGIVIPDCIRVPFLGLFNGKSGTVPFWGPFRFWDCFKG
jgi:hypothetical protein